MSIERVKDDIEDAQDKLTQAIGYLEDAMNNCGKLDDRGEVYDKLSSELSRLWDIDKELGKIRRNPYA